MSTVLRELRRGLPRIPGGEPWPPSGTVEIEVGPDYLAETATAAEVTAAAADVAATPDARFGTAASVTTMEGEIPDVGAEPIQSSSAAVVLATEQRQVPLRRGLPRTPGGEPWPPAGSGVLTIAVEQIDLGTPRVDTSAVVSQNATTVTPQATTAPASAVLVSAVETTIESVPLRRGLPRTKGGEPWPPAGFGMLSVPVVQDEPVSSPALDDQIAALTADTGEPAAASRETSPVAVAAAAAPAVSDARATAQPTTRPGAPSVTAGKVHPAATAAPAARRPGVGTTAAPQPRNFAAMLTSAVQLVRFPALAVVGAIAVVGGSLMLVRWLMGTDAMTAFLVRYPGEYELPHSAKPGFPGWLRWSHFLNMFFIVLIIRSGLQNRYEKKPPAYWTPKWQGFGGGKKISISLWLHQALDFLWLFNGIVFVVLLFATGYWMRIVPTSWEVFPNALSALLQYISLDWPTDNGWVNYNSLQQLTYFTVVFVAAPLAALTGFRMSGLWPAKAKRLSAVYPVEAARAVHFPTMLFFVIFLIMHVAMVFATGALRNLNHMFAGTDATNWAGFWIFTLALTFIAIVWELARPIVMAPIANLFGNVSQR